MADTQQHDVNIGLIQANSHLGDIAANTDKIIQMRERAAALGADIIITPEMFLSGYPADDLVLRDDFMARIDSAIGQLAELTSDGGPAIIVGAPYREAGRLTNACFILDDGQIIARRDKVNLPNYGVFDDKRHFTQGALQGPVSLRGVRLGLAICEDIWFEDVVETVAESGAEMILSLNASPFESGKTDQRIMHGIARITESGLPLIYVNMTGGQDELVFDGGSFALNCGGGLAAQLPQFTETVSLVTARKDANGQYSFTGQITPPDEPLEAIWRALTLSIRDYVQKNGFPGVVLGLSGGVDSAIVAVLAVDALGADKVKLVMMPSYYTADISLSDATTLASNLGIALDDIPIRQGMDAFDNMLAEMFAGRGADVTEENIQSRLRGMLLMAISNKLGHMVLATGNKSEYAAGYSTLYGDMCGGFAPLKDVWKTTVFELCNWRNAHLPKGALGPEGEVIPTRIITRPPSSELRP